MSQPGIRKIEKPLLLLDAASPLVQTGLWREGRWIRWTSSRTEAGRSLFSGVTTLLNEEGISIRELGGFLFCAGPGSMLGIRIAAMAIRGWQALLDDPLPVFSYSSHEWLARRQLTLGTPPPFHVISDARRNHWNVTSVLEPGVVSPVRQILAEEIPHLPGPLYRMEEIVRAQPPIPVREMLLYDLKEDPALFLEPNFARFTEIPDALILAGPEYKKWTAERHR